MIKILRMGHRCGRDDRISTHVGLVARQLSGKKIIYAGERDTNMMESLRDTVNRWGGQFQVEYTENPKKIIQGFDGIIAHLTMYGEKVGDVEQQIKEKTLDQDLLVIVGAEKVPRYVYKQADYNVSVGNQPHSEIAALAIFLDRIQEESIKQNFEDADIEVVPSEQDKITKEKQE